MTQSQTITQSQSYESDPGPRLVPPTLASFGFQGGAVKARNATNSKLQGGVHLEVNPLRFLGIQGQVDYRTEERFDFNPGSAQAGLNVRTVPITLSGKLYLPILPSFSPYALAGAGWYHQKLDFAPELRSLGFQNRTDTHFGWHIGFGGLLAVNQRVGLFMEGRWVFLDPNRDLNPSTIQRVEKLNFDSSNITGGISFFF